MEEARDTRQSEFNELAFKMARINKLQDKINTFWQNPKGLWFNPELDSGGAEYGWVLIFSSLRSLYMETRPKCNDDERGKADKFVEIITDYLEKDKIFIVKQVYNQYIKEINPEQWGILRKNLQNFEALVRDLLDKHGFSPDIDDGGLF